MVSKKVKNAFFLYFLLGIMFLPNISIFNTNIRTVQDTSSSSLTNSNQSGKIHQVRTLINPLPHLSQTTQNQITSSTKIVKTNSNYTLGQTEKFWVEDLGNISSGADGNHDGKSFLQGDWADGMYQITAVVVNITKNAYIFADQVIASYYQGVNGLGAKIAQEFETRIQPSDLRLGTPSDIDHNGKIIILIFDFKEGNSNQGYYTTGYFWPVNMHKPSTDPSSIDYYSAYKEIININDIAIRSSGSSEAVWAPTLAHEYFHLIHYKYNPNEKLWLEEGLAVFAENLAGFKSGYISYLQDSNQNGYFLHAYDHSLTYFSQSLESYGQSFLFVQYLYQRFGLNFIRNIVQTNMSGLNAIKYQIEQLHTNITFDQVYSDWMITNLVNDQTNRTYSYRNFTFRISQSEYDVNSKLSIVPDEFDNHRLSFWSNEFFTLPQNGENPYLITFLPQILANTSTYQLTVVTFHNQTSWNYEKIPLVDQKSGSFMVKYNSINDKKVLIISSLVGDSSGDNSIPQDQVLADYSTGYYLYAKPFTYKPVFEPLNTSSYYPSYNVNIYSLTNQKLNDSVITSVNMNVYIWNSKSYSPVLTSTLTYDKQNQNWIIDGKIFQKLANNQYYFTLVLQTTNKTTVMGLTFLLENQNSNFFGQLSNESFIAVGIVVVVAIPITLLLKRKRR